MLPSLNHSAQHRIKSEKRKYAKQSSISIFASNAPRMSLKSVSETDFFENKGPNGLKSIYASSTINQNVAVVLSLHSFSPDYTDFATETLRSYDLGDPGVSFYLLDFDPYRIPYTFPPNPPPVFKTGMELLRERKLNLPAPIIHPMKVFPGPNRSSREGPPTIPWGSISIFIRGFLFFTQRFQTRRYGGAHSSNFAIEDIEETKLQIEKVIVACVLFGMLIIAKTDEPLPSKITKFYDQVKLSPPINYYTILVSRILEMDELQFGKCFGSLRAARLSQFIPSGFVPQLVSQQFVSEQFVSHHLVSHEQEASPPCSSMSASPEYEISLEDRVEQLEKTVSHLSGIIQMLLSRVTQK